MRGNEDSPEVTGSGAPAPVLVCYATRSDGSTLDTDAQGGNPFATALIELANEDDVPLSALMPRLRELTERRSAGHQVPEHRGRTNAPTWQFSEVQSTRHEKREALVLVVSNYSAWERNASLRGAAVDERRVAAMLAQHGFSVTQGIGPARDELRRALTSFRRRSLSADVSIIYSTGHGVESNGHVHLVPGDYPISGGFRAGSLRHHALSVTQMVSATRAHAVNVVFFAGCRTDSRRAQLGVERVDPPAGSLLQPRP